jgi:TonB-linked SusC/RagA family outer membrane protein
MVLGLMQVYASSYSQSTKLSVSGRNLTLEKVFGLIEDQSEFSFFYNLKQIDLTKTFDVSVEDQTVDRILDEVLKGTNMTYTINDRLIVVHRKGETGDIGTVSQQQKSVSGVVTEESGQPLPGVTVMVKGTTRGTVTNNNGSYSLSNIPGDATLVFSFVGMKSQEVVVGNQTSIDIILLVDAIGLDEVVAIGYGTMKKSDLVGSISSVSQEKLEESSSPNIFQAMQGAAPGISIQRGSGEPGSSGNIQIRGITSISASNYPLIIFDGIPFAGDIRDINPDDIASVEVLKDASAAAIYGSRAANGVILITSKSGTDSGTVIELNSSWSFQNEAVKYELMGPDAFYAFRKEGFRADNLLDGVAEADIPATILQVNELKSYERGESVDWMDEMINQNAMVQNYQVSVRTGNKNLKDYFSISFNEEEGLQQTTGFSRLTLKNNLELIGIADWIKIGDNLMYSYNDYERREFSINNQPAYYRLSPFARIYEDDGSYTKHPQANDNLFINPVAEDKLTARENNFNNFFNNFYFVITPKVVEGLSFRMNLGSTLRNTYNASYLKRGTFIGDANGGQAEIANSKTMDLTWENILNYSRDFSGHSIDFTGLYSRQYNKYNYDRISASGFVSDDYLWHNLGAAENIGNPASSLNEWQLVSYMARLNYNYKSKYYLTATGRQDGYSGFATNNKYGFFPSFAFAWRMSNENFMEDISWLDDLKLRASYGSLGNQAVGTYRSLARLGLAQHIFGEEVTSGLTVTSLPNANLSWETTKTMNLAVDFNILAGRVAGTLEYYDSHTFDILLNRSIPAMTGQGDIIYNIGEVQNSGFEAAINTIPIKKGDFTWKLDINFSTNKNKIVDLYGDGKDDVANRWFIGKPLNIYYDYEADGIYQLGDEEEIANSATPDREVGDTRIVDQGEKDGIIDADDRKIVGYLQPKWIGGVNSTFTWKDLSLNIFVQTTQGMDRRFNPEGDWGGRVNRPPVDYWTPENPSNTWFRPHASTPNPFYGSLDIYDASYVRIKDVTLSYNIPKSILQNVALSKMRVYVNLHDYFTFTKFPYADPEIGQAFQISIPKYVQLGLNITF